MLATFIFMKGFNEVNTDAEIESRVDVSCLCFTNFDA
jgi:hypothetical protein